MSLMSRSLQFVLALSFVSFSMGAWAAGAAKVDFAVGPVDAVTANGLSRTLVKGDPVASGETVRTGSGARAQLRFNDGGMVSLQPNTDFRLDDYNFSGKDDAQDRGFFSLLRGGLRTITGMVGRVNKDNYKITTSVATIGIRGTEYTLSYIDSETIAVATGEGVVQVCNGGGCVLLSSGDSVVVRGADGAAQRVTFRPRLDPAQPGEKLLVATFSTSEARNPDGSLAVFGSRLVSGGGYRLAYTGFDTSNNLLAPAVSSDDVSAVFDSSSGLLEATTTGGEVFKGGTLAGAGSADSVIGWGRWVGGQAPVSGVQTPLNGLHYVVGKTTSASDLTALGNTSFTYNVVGGSLPTSSTGVLGANIPTGTLTLGFSGGSVSSSTLNMSLNFNSSTYSINSTSFSSISPATFSIPTIEYTGGVTGGSAQGFVAGAGASHAGLGYKISTMSDGTVAGSVAFKR
jgi:hypothetical protein